MYSDSEKASIKEAIAEITSVVEDADGYLDAIAAEVLWNAGLVDHRETRWTKLDMTTLGLCVRKSMAARGLIVADAAADAPPAGAGTGAEDIAKAMLDEQERRAARKPKSEREQLWAWLNETYPGNRLTGDYWDGLSANEQRHYAAEWETAKAKRAKAADPNGKIKMPPMPGEVATLSAAQQNNWLNIAQAFAHGYCDVTAFDRAELPRPAVHESKTNTGKGFE